MYRQASSSPPRVLSVRVDPVGLSIVLLVIAFGLVGGGIVLAAFTDLEAGVRIMATIPLELMGLIFLAIAARMLLTTVRFEVTDTVVKVDWYRLGRRLRGEVLNRADVVDVALDASPSSGNMVYSVALGTRLGDISLGNMRSSAQGGYVAIQRRIAEFLGVPARPS